MNPQLSAVSEIAETRRQVQKILASTEFAPSRQLRDFLLYISEAALQGRTHLDQIEIADQVLKRGKEFSPLDDASVRKLGTALRQRLQKYYDTEGADDPIRVTLPVRSYIPSFEVRQPAAAIVAELAAVPDPLVVQPRSRRWILVGGAAAVATAATAVTGWWWKGRSDDVRPAFTIHTRQGDVMHSVNDIAPDAILLGPRIGESDEVTTRLVFTPERATQQAGLLVYGDADRYVKLGRQFLARPQLEFGMESYGRYTKPAGTFAYDPDAQTGDPVWLTIRRDKSEYRAFISNEGLNWRSFGNVLSMPQSMADARAALFAHNGRSNAPSTEARFDRVGVGLSFHNRPVGPADPGQFAGWRTLSAEGRETRASFDGEALVLDNSTEDSTRTVDFVRRAPDGDWTLVTRLDFLSMNGSTAGLSAVGPKGRFRLIRWDLDGGSITAEHLGSRQFNVKDAEGAPPVTLRMTCRSGELSCSVSRDDRRFQEIPLRIPVRELTTGEYFIGLHVSISSWKPGEPRVPARFFYVRQEVHSLTPRGAADAAKS